MSDSTAIERLLAYLPPDRAAAVLGGAPLPAHDVGAVLFSDISGFTPLTEAVIQRFGPRQGGEQFTDHLNTVYDALIREATRFGGSIVGFAGDAMLVWFSGDDGATAVTAGLQMQRAMTRFAEIALPGGETISLAMKVAVAAGPVRRLAVGDPHIQSLDVLAGTVLERVAACEGVAARGEIVVDEGIALRLGPRLQVRERRALGPGPGEAGTATVVTGLEPAAPARPRPPLPRPDDAAARLRPWLLPEVARRITSGQDLFLTELRPATALFTRFTGLDFERDPAAAAKLDSYICWVQRIVARLEGVLAQVTLGEKGSYFYAAWGAPVAHEDDTRRACTAALEFIHPPPEIAGLGLTAQVGITSGTMRTGAYGSRERRTYGLLGDDTNLAARLMARAGPNEILISAQAARRQLEAFDLQPLPAVTVKGKQAPVPLFRLQGRRQTSLHLRAPTAPLLGRRRELSLALARLRLAASGRGQVLVLSGEAGMGKSRLLAELVQESAALGFTPLTGDCPALGRDAAYSGWIPVWRSFFQLPPAAEAETALALIALQLPPEDQGLLARTPLLGPLLNLTLPDNDLTRTLDARTRRSSLEGLLVECLRHRSQRGPLLLVLDECHWIDEASRTLLGTLIPAIARLPVAILLAHRPVPPGEVIAARDLTLEHLTALTLGDLPPEEARQLIAHKFAALFGADAAPPALLDRIAARAGGNPFFIEEVANLLQARGVNPRDPRTAETLELPESLHSLVLGRIDQLGEDTQTTLKIASVIGRIFRTAVLFGVHPLEHLRASLPAQLTELQQRDLAIPEPGAGDETYLFRHIVIQEVAYESLPFGLRATLHETIGRHLEQVAGDNLRPWVDLLAFHFGRSHCDDKKRRYLVAAGDAARAAYALESATSHYQRALELLTGDERIAVLTRLGEVLELTGRWNDAFARYHEARDLAERAGRTTEQAALAGAVGDLHRRRGEFDAAETWIARAREENAVLGNNSGVALMLHLEGTLCAQTGKFARASDLFHRALALREQLGDDAATAKTLNNLGIVARSQGDIDTALAHYERSLAIRRRVNDRREIANSLNNLGFTHRFRRDFVRARELLGESVQLNRAVGDRWSTANALTSLAELALDTGDAGLAQRCLQESITINRELGDRRALAFLLEGVGRLAVLRDDPASAWHFFSAARGLRDSIGAPLEPADAQALAAIVEAARARIDPALHHRLKAEALRLPLGEIVDQALAACAAPPAPPAASAPGSH